MAANLWLGARMVGRAGWKGKISGYPPSVELGTARKGEISDDRRERCIARVEWICVVAGSGIAPFHGGVDRAYDVPSMESRVCRGGAGEIVAGEGELAATSSVVQERVGRRRESRERTCLGDDDVGVTEGDGAGAVVLAAGDPEVAGLLGVVAGDEDADLGGPPQMDHGRLHDAEHEVPPAGAVALEPGLPRRGGGGGACCWRSAGERGGSAGIREDGGSAEDGRSGCGMRGCRGCGRLRRGCGGAWREGALGSARTAGTASLGRGLAGAADSTGVAGAATAGAGRGIAGGARWHNKEVWTPTLKT
jgi:hypothetical protein|eukprot:XP_020398701.1 uncharacterized protein LOC109941868 [Zea mays]